MKPTPEQLKKVKALWALDKSEISFIRRVENFVYEAQLDGRPVILRLTEPVHRSKEQIESELDWMDFLRQNGISLASPIQSCSQAFVEKVEGDHIFFVSVFEKAPGGPLKEPEEFTPEVFETWGRYLGKMQRLTLNYQPASSIQKRPQWNEDSLFQVVLKGLDRDDEIPFQRFQQQMAWLQSLPKDQQSYGLVHCDLHYGNFFISQQKITAFDFDDCCYHWFMYDTVTPLFHIQQKRDLGELNVPYQELEESYMSGYLKEFSVDPIWIKRMPLFAKFRINTVYHWAKASSAAGLFDENENAKKWCERLFLWGKDQLKDEPVFV